MDKMFPGPLVQVQVVLGLVALVSVVLELQDMNEVFPWSPGKGLGNVRAFGMEQLLTQGCGLTSLVPTWQTQMVLRFGALTAVFLELQNTVRTFPRSLRTGTGDAWTLHEVLS
jgi:hypothetical protein